MYVILLDNCGAGFTETRMFTGWDGKEPDFYLDNPVVFYSLEDVSKEIKKIQKWMDEEDDPEIFDLRFAEIKDGESETLKEVKKLHYLHDWKSVSEPPSMRDGWGTTEYYECFLNNRTIVILPFILNNKEDIHDCSGHWPEEYADKITHWKYLTHPDGNDTLVSYCPTGGVAERGI